MTTAAEAPRPVGRPAGAAPAPAPYGAQRARLYGLFASVTTLNRRTVALCLGIPEQLASVMLAAGVSEGRLRAVEYAARRPDGVRVGYALRGEA